MDAPRPSGDRPDPSRPAGTDMLPQIKHIVILMMENHSFDNYLGTLGRGEGFPLGDDGTPDAENPDSEQLVAGPDAYDTYGFRVPAVILSPYARPDCVLPDVFDHTSVLKLVEEKWNLPALTRRDAAATSSLGALDLTAAPAFLTPPRLPEPALAWGTW